MARGTADNPNRMLERWLVKMDRAIAKEGLSETPRKRECEHEIMALAAHMTPSRSIFFAGNWRDDFRTILRVILE